MMEIYRPLLPASENYSPILTSGVPGEPPPTLFEICSSTMRWSSSMIATSRAAAWRHVIAATSAQGEPADIASGCPLHDQTARCGSKWDAMRPQNTCVFSHVAPGHRTGGGVFVEQVIRLPY